MPTGFCRRRTRPSVRIVTGEDGYERAGADSARMSPISRRLTALARRVHLRDERGSMLIELIVVSSLLTVVLGATFAVMTTTARRAPAEQERAQSIREAQASLHRMTRELRQAYEVNSTSYVHMDVNVHNGASNRRVAYDCGVASVTAGLRACVRYEAAVGAALPASGEVVIDRLRNGLVTEAGRVFFADDPLRPKFVRAKVDVPAKGAEAKGYGHSVVLDDGIYLRNRNLG